MWQPLHARAKMYLLQRRLRGQTWNPRAGCHLSCHAACKRIIRSRVATLVTRWQYQANEISAVVGCSGHTRTERLFCKALCRNGPRSNGGALKMFLIKPVKQLVRPNCECELPKADRLCQSSTCSQLISMFISKLLGLFFRFTMFMPGEINIKSWSDSSFNWKKNWLRGLLCSAKASSIILSRAFPCFASSTTTSHLPGCSAPPGGLTLQPLFHLRT